MPSVFLEKSQPPTEKDLAATLGPALGFWNAVREVTKTACPPIEEKWGYSGKKYGWSLVLKGKKRAVLYLIPGEGIFTVSMALGEKAAEAALQSGLPPHIANIIEQAPKYPEGRAVRFDIGGEEDIALVNKLAVIKMAF